MILLLDIVFSVSMAALIHEMGHFFTALIYGQFIDFRFSRGWIWKIPIPRCTWEMPKSLTSIQKRRVAIAGFGAEFLVVPILYFLLPYYPFITTLHLIVYPFYAGEMSDFQWLDNGFLGVSKRGWIWINVLLFCAVCWTVIYYIGKMCIRCFI